jgi:hypothetical protein
MDSISPVKQPSLLNAAARSIMLRSEKFSGLQLQREIAFEWPKKKICLR